MTYILLVSNAGQNKIKEREDDYGRERKRINLDLFNQETFISHLLFLSQAQRDKMMNKA